MDKSNVIPQVREKVNQIGSVITTLHPLVPQLNDPPTQSEVLRALFELTKQVEVIKKHLLKLEKRDESSLL